MPSRTAATISTGRGTPHTRRGVPVTRGVTAGSAGRNSLALLLDLGGLAAKGAQVVELGATDVTAGHDLDLVDDRGVHGERALDTDAEADLANGEGLPDAIALTADDDALEDLHAGTRAFDD